MLLWRQPRRSSGGWETLGNSFGSYNSNIHALSIPVLQPWIGWTEAHRCSPSRHAGVHSLRGFGPAAGVSFQLELKKTHKRCRQCFAQKVSSTTLQLGAVICSLIPRRERMRLLLHPLLWIWAATQFNKEDAVAVGRLREKPSLWDEWKWSRFRTESSWLTVKRRRRDEEIQTFVVVISQASTSCSSVPQNCSDHSFKTRAALQRIKLPGGIFL